MASTSVLPSGEWRQVAGFPGRYVSPNGRVWSDLRRPGRMLKPALDQNGYPIVALWDVERQVGVSRRVHILVAETFLGPRPPGSEVRHLNGDPADPRLENLVYGTKSENAYDSVRHGTHVQARKSFCVNGHAFTAENVYVRTDRPNRRECRTCRREATLRSQLRRARAGESDRVD